MKKNHLLFKGSYGYHYSDVGLAELLLSMATLKPNSSEACASIVTTLGLEWRDEKEKQASYLESSFEPIVGSSGSSTKDSISEQNVPDQTPEPVLPVNSHKKILEPIGYEKQIHEIMFNNPILSSTEELEPTNLTFHMKSPEPRPLLRNEWFRGLISVMLATPRASRDIDWRILEKNLTNGRSLDSLPWRQQSTLKRGVQLILDRSESMQPFWHDEKELLIRLRGYLGSRNVKVSWLEIDRWLSIKSKLKWHSSSPFQFSVGTPLVIVSDFGIGEGLDGEGKEELEPWLPLLRMAKNHNCPVIALVPAPESFWPKILKQLIPYVFVWDYHTSIQSVRRLIGRIH